MNNIYYLLLFLILFIDLIHSFLVDPTFLLVDEDLPVGSRLPITICPQNIKILSGDQQKTFSIVKLNDTCATLQLNKQLDADKEALDGSHGQSFSLVLRGARNTQMNVEIQVVDVNDNVPTFINTPNIITLPEDLPVGSPITKIRVADVDTGIAGISKFLLEGDDIFLLDKRKCTNGECWTTLRLAKELDYERQRLHQLTIEARDGDPEAGISHIANHSITIHVTDVQDTGPRFVSDLSLPVIIEPSNKEEDILITIKAEDGDIMNEQRNIISYSMDANDFVYIDKTTGQIRLKKVPQSKIDMRVTVTAKENDSIGMSTKGEIRVKSLQIVESQEQTEPSVLCSQIARGRIHKGLSIFDIQPILHLNYPVKASAMFIEGGNDAFVVSANSNDEMIVKLEVKDPEAIRKMEGDTVDVQVSSPNGGCRVSIELVNSVDKNPIFLNDTFLFYVNENHKPTVLGIVKAVSGNKNPLEYSILGDQDGFFSISSEGELRTVEPIDREKKERFNIVIRATDSNGKWTDCPGKVVVRDINDNSPQFEKEQYLLEIDEEKSMKTKITVTDLDQGENGQISYSIDNLPEGIPIDFSSGILFFGKIDRDTLESEKIEIILRATDKGIPERTGTANMTVLVKDINDNYPVFSNSQYSLILDANISPGGVIGGVNAEDADATSPNNYVTYTTDDNRFRISDKGEIIYTGEGVLSKDSSLEFTAVAVDGGLPRRNATSKVVINEHKSSMKNELTAEINETEIRTEIKWANSGMNGYSYEIVRATSSGFKDFDVKKWVEIDKESGKIHTLKAISAEDVREIKLYISMTKGKREVPVELIIKVVDSENGPFFKNETYKAIVPENTSVGVKILEVKATGETENHKYSLQVDEGNPETITIDQQTGWITVAKTMEFEKDRRVSGRVTVVDEEGNNATTVFQLQLTNTNDNRPVFKNGSIFTVELNESAAVGTVLQLPYPLATDDDAGRNGALFFSLLAGDDHFEIDKKTSIIKLKKELDYEKQRTHSVMLKCVDREGKEGHLEAFGAVTILVGDVNDNAPVLHNSDLKRLSVSEDSSPSTVITVLSASDADKGGNEKVIFLNANHSLFRIDSEHRLMVAKELKGYAGERICSSIIASDTGVPPRNSTYPYCVTVYPATNNHHNPLIVFPKPNSIHYFDENVQFEQLLRIKLLEEEEMKDINYRLDTTFKKDWEFFSIDNNGTLIAEEPFDFEKKNVHELKVLACRGLNCSSVHIFISVNDRNDNCPIFPKQDITLSLTENDKSPTPRQIGRIPTALDNDFHADNTKVCYSTESSLFFFADSTLPVLYTNTSFDREQKKQHVIAVTAYDCQLSCRDPHQPMNTTLTVIINILDVNDNFPKFAERTYYATVIQGQVSPGSHLTAVTATDVDDEKGSLKYAIKGIVRAGKLSYPANELPISIDILTGEISSNDVMRESLYSFTVTVTDGAGHEDNANVMERGPTELVTTSSSLPVWLGWSCYKFLKKNTANGISVVTYSQQIELLFDAPFEFIVKNEKHIVSLLSDITQLTAVIDRCRQNANFTLVLAHFADSNGQFVGVERVVSMMSNTNSTARRELKNAYGLRDAIPPPQAARAIMPEVVAIAVASVLMVILLLICCCLCRRKRNAYDNKLRQLSMQTSIQHTSLVPPVKKMTPVSIPNGYYIDGHLSTRMQAPQPPLQSTEL